MMTATPNSYSKSTEVDPLQPLSYVGTLKCVLTVFRKRGFWILSTSAMAMMLFAWVSFGIRFLMRKLNTLETETAEMELNGVEYDYHWHPYSVTFRRIGACLQMLVFYVIQVPADAINIRLIAEYFTGHNPSVMESCRSAILGGAWIHMLLTCFTWCCAVLLPLVFLVWWSGPESDDPHYGRHEETISVLPFFPKVIGGTMYAIASTWILVVTYTIYGNIVVSKDRFCQSTGRWTNKGYHISCILLTWFLVKLLLNKLLAAALVFSSSEPILSQDGNIVSPASAFARVLLSSQYGIPLHPVDVLWTPNGEFSYHWAHMVLGILFSAIGSIFQAILFIDTRVKTAGFGHDQLCDELGLESQKGSYSSMWRRGGCDKEDQVVPVV